MEPFAHTKAIFEQLAEADGSDGVHTIIENHDAWLHNTAVQIKIDAAMRAKLARAPRPESVSRQIERQRQKLQSLITRLPLRISSAS